MNLSGFLLLLSTLPKNWDGAVDDDQSQSDRQTTEKQKSDV